MVLPSFYLPPISWFVRLVQSDEPIAIEQWANYRKQTFHNRCYIDSPNGKLALTIPVDRSTFVGGKCLMKDVQISDHSDWQRQHWYALESSYFNSPFFEYLQDDFHPVYLKRWKWLMDLNEALVEKCLEEIKPPSQPSPLGEGVVTEINGDYRIERTSEFQGPALVSDIPTESQSPALVLDTDALAPSGVIDRFATLSEKERVGERGCFSSYYQLFSHKHGFLPDLSIIDLIFNMGPESIIYLHNMVGKGIR